MGRELTGRDELRYNRTSASCSTGSRRIRSEEHTSELQSRLHLVCRLLLEKKKTLDTNLLVHNPRLPRPIHLSAPLPGKPISFVSVLLVPDSLRHAATPDSMRVPTDCPVLA